MIEDILVCLEGSASSACAIDAAIGLGRQLRARLAGLAIVDEPDIRAGEPTGIGGSSYKAQRDEALLADAHRHAQAWLDGFAQRCRDAGLTAQTLELEGRPVETIVRQMQRYDLTVMGRDVNFRFETHDRDRYTRDMVLRRSGKPMLVVPDAPAPSGSGALIAWDGSTAARRALEAFAASGLAEGRELHVVAVDDDGATAWDMATRGVQLLRAHDLDARVHNVVSLLPVAGAILEQRDKLGAGLVVLGAYVPSRLTRWLWGSVTHEIVEKAPVPLFLHY